MLPGARLPLLAPRLHEHDSLPALQSCIAIKLRIVLVSLLQHQELCTLSCF